MGLCSVAKLSAVPLIMKRSGVQTLVKPCTHKPTPYYAPFIKGHALVAKSASRFLWRRVDMQVLAGRNNARPFSASPDNKSATKVFRSQKRGEHTTSWNKSQASKVQPVAMQGTQLPSGKLSTRDRIRESIDGAKEQISVSDKFSSFHITTEPYIYISTLPSKQYLAQLVDVLNTWYSVPKISTETIRQVVTTLHNVSLM